MRSSALSSSFGENKDKGYSDVNSFSDYMDFRAGLDAELDAAVTKYGLTEKEAQSSK